MIGFYDSEEDCAEREDVLDHPSLVISWEQMAEEENENSDDEFEWPSDNND